jgi:hypothetical protein
MQIRKNSSILSSNTAFNHKPVSPTAIVGRWHWRGEVGESSTQRFFFFFFFFFFFGDRVSLCSLGCPGTHSVDQASLRNLPAFASLVLGLKACATTPCLARTFIF